MYSDLGLNSRGGSFSLVSLDWEAKVNGLLFTYTVTQVYKNSGTETREVSYSFPVGWGTVLADFQAEVGGELLRNTHAEAHGRRALRKGAG